MASVEPTQQRQQLPHHRVRKQQQQQQQPADDDDDGNKPILSPPQPHDDNAPRRRTVREHINAVQTWRPQVQKVGWAGDRWVIFPNNPMIVLWDLLTLFLLVIQAWTIPFEVGAYGGQVWLVTGFFGLFGHLCLTIFFLADTILYFFRAIRDSEGRLIWRLEEICWAYFTSWFIFDLISCLPAYTIAYMSAPARGSADYHFLEMLQLLRLLRLTRINRRLWASPVLTKMSLRVSWRAFQLFRVVITSIYVAHCIACIWCFAFQLQDGPTWVHKYLEAYPPTGGVGFHVTDALDPLNNALDLYILALYWASVTMTSVGYGDVLPLTRAEYWVCSVCVLVSGFLWAWVVAQLVDVVSDISRADNELRARLSVLNRAPKPEGLVSAKDYDVWQDLMDEARMYLHTQYVRRKNFSESEYQEVLGHLSQGIRDRVLMSRARSNLLRIPYFCECRARTVMYLESQMVRRNFGVQEAVVHDPSLVASDGAGSSERYLYFIIHGTMLAVQGPRLAEMKQWTIYRPAKEVAHEIVSGVVVHDTDGTLDSEEGQAYWKQSHISVLPRESFFDPDNFALPNHSPNFRPTRLKALTYCETLALPRSAFVQAIKMDPTLAKAVKWRRIKVGLKFWAKRVLKDEGVVERTDGGGDQVSIPAARTMNGGGDRHSDDFSVGGE